MAIFLVVVTEVVDEIRFVVVFIIYERLVC